MELHTIETAMCDDPMVLDAVLASSIISSANSLNENSINENSCPINDSDIGIINDINSELSNYNLLGMGISENELNLFRQYEVKQESESKRRAVNSLAAFGENHGVLENCYSNEFCEITTKQRPKVAAFIQQAARNRIGYGGCVAKRVSKDQYYITT